MNQSAPIGDLPHSFRDEQRQLSAEGITTWEALRSLSDLELSRMARSGRATARNLKRLRGMADLVCCLNLAPADAALLMHAGIATVPALAAATPQVVVTRTGRLERQLRSSRPPVVDLAVARRWIAAAQRWQPSN